jgi:enoyl-[acyl-carrier protein] reductase III
MVNEFSHKEYMALILGGSSGLGLAAAKKLAAHGMGICIIHRNSRSEMNEIEQDFEAIKSMGVPFLAFNADASHEGKRAEIVEQLQAYKGRFRCLLHSIAKGSLKAMQHENESEALTTEDIRITMEHMAYSLYDWTIALHQNGLFAQDARVLAYTSEGSHRAIKHYSAISAAKATLEALTRSIALEFAPAGIRANCIQAGITATASMKKIPLSEEIEAFTKKRNPYQRLTTPEDIANVVYLLCKDEAAWINGSIIPVDGGEHIC